VSFVRLILEEHDYRSIGYYAQKLGVTDRTLRDDLKDVTVFLGGVGLELTRKTGKGVLLEDAVGTRDVLNRKLQEQHKGVEYVTLDSRRTEILRELLSDSQHYISIQKLSDRYFVSRTSIVNDLKYVEEWLEHHALILYRGVAGTKISGSETNIRKAFAALIEESEDGEEAGFPPCQSRINNLTMSSLLKLFRLEDILFLERLLKELEANIDCTIGEPYYLNLITHLLICVERVSKGQRVEEPGEHMAMELRTLSAYHSAVKMATDIEQHFDIRLGDSEVYYIYQYLISFGVGTKTDPEQEKKQEPEDIGRTLGAELVHWVSEAMGVNLSLNEKLEKELHLHLRSMLNRVTYDIQVRNSLLSQIQELYPDLLALLEGAMWVLGQKYRFGPVSPDETAYIAVYFQVAVERTQSQPRILVVCQSGYGTSQLLKTRIDKAFPQWEVSGVVSARALETMDLSTYSFVLSTVTLPALPIPHVVISALLSERDVEKIRELGLLVGQIGGTWRETADAWLREGILELTEDFGLWQMWRREAESGAPEGREIAGGRLSAMLFLGARASHIRVLWDSTEHRPRALIQAGEPKEAELMLTGYCRVIQDGCDWERMADNLAQEELLRALLPGRQILTAVDAADKSEAVELLVHHLHETGYIADEATLCRDVFLREEEGSTAIGDGIALPHGQSWQVEGIALAMAVLRNPVIWNMDGDEALYVQTIVLFAINPEKARQRDSKYIQALSAVCTALDDPECIASIRAARCGEGVIQAMVKNIRSNVTEEKNDG
ncbi:MAG: BglG family transcription antiterminator, partial [Lawsonibacter sp.]|nr:BglG family transcription antiterminator [Lawsonibacter sp.]